MHILDKPPAPADERVPYGNGPYHFGDLRLPAQARPQELKSLVPIVVVVHGGFWRSRFDLEHISHACAAITRLGFATWSLEYRRIGHEGGGWPGTFLDVASGIDHLRDLAPRYNLDLERVITIGHSAGGHLALWLAARGRIPPWDPLHTPSPLPVRSAISLAGVVDLRMGWEMKLSNNVVEEFLGGTPRDVPERYATASPREMLPIGVRQVLVHGTEDDSVPYEISRSYHDAAVAEGDSVELVPLPGAEHFEVIDSWSAEWKKVEAALLDVTSR